MSLPLPLRISCHCCSQPLRKDMTRGILLLPKDWASLRQNNTSGLPSSPANFRRHLGRCVCSPCQRPSPRIIWSLGFSAAKRFTRVSKCHLWKRRLVKGLSLAVLLCVLCSIYLSFSYHQETQILPCIYLFISCCLQSLLLLQLFYLLSSL